MNVIVEGFIINWSNVNCLNRRNNRLYFTSGDQLKLHEDDKMEIVEAIIGSAASTEIAADALAKVSP